MGEGPHRRRLLTEVRRGKANLSGDGQHEEDDADPGAERREAQSIAERGDDGYGSNQSQAHAERDKKATTSAHCLLRSAQLIADKLRGPRPRLAATLWRDSLIRLLGWYSRFAIDLSPSRSDRPRSGLGP